MLAVARVIFGAVAASAVATVVARNFKEKLKRIAMRNVCALCLKDLSENNRSLKCCDSKFHRDCLRAYVQSLDGCPIKCPGCEKTVTLDDKERREYQVPISTERVYYCHHCDSIVEHTKPRVLPCTHRFCIGCVRQWMMANVAMMGEKPRCPMDACRQPLSDDLHDSIIRLE